MMNQPKPGPEPAFWIGFYNAVPIALALWSIICLVIWAVVELFRSTTCEVGGALR